VPQGEGGPDTYDNGIPVCFECHADIHSYNPNHPRGRKFQPSELRAHREQWLLICREHPDIFRRGSIARADVGPLQALIDELEFNEEITQLQPGPDFCSFKEDQFLEAIRRGSISTLKDGPKQAINEAYVQIGHVNQRIRILTNQHSQAMMYEISQYEPSAIAKAGQAIRKAKQELLEFLSSEA
jgi:hypothetical protein